MCYPFNSQFLIKIGIFMVFSFLHTAYSFAVHQRVSSLFQKAIDWASLCDSFINTNNRLISQAVRFFLFPVSFFDMAFNRICKKNQFPPAINHLSEGAADSHRMRSAAGGGIRSVPSNFCVAPSDSYTLFTIPLLQIPQASPLESTNKSLFWLYCLLPFYTKHVTQLI